ncbi:hypothetical protein WMY93_004640 [Mugilogobius chulae]|uniref:C2 domain-containing protein n=1 Tax=Mugilogobius chulae TaxID=88201 RepID=A0AAW0PPJ4_9GOBI
MASPLLLLLVLGVSLSWAQVKIYDLRASDLPSSIFATTDGYVKVFCGPADLGKTETRDDDINPWWKEEFTYFKAQENDVLRLEVFDDDILFDDLLGVCQRQIKVGTHKHDCFLEKGGTLHYTYTLNARYRALRPSLHHVTMKSVTLLLLCSSILCCWAQTQLRVFNLRAKGLPQDALGITDGYVKVFCRDDLVGQTSVRKNTADPWWKEEYTYYTAQLDSELKLEVHDEDLIWDDLVGTCLTQVQPGTHQKQCVLEKGGMLFYDYTLS